MSPSATGVYEPNPPGGGTFVSKDGRFRFSYSPPWFISPENEPATIRPVNNQITQAELVRRDAAEDYSSHDGEGFVGISFDRAQRTMAAIRRAECHAADTVLMIRECSVRNIHGQSQLWVLKDWSDDSDCTCREVYIIAGGREYAFEGGGCLQKYCNMTSSILKQVDRIFASASVG